MRVLVDTSVWSQALGRYGPADHPAVKKLSTLLEDKEDVHLIGLILQEILQAFRSERVLSKVAEYLEPVPLLDFQRDDYVAAARLHRVCASKGVSATTADCQVATAAIRHDCLLLTSDRDFELIARHSSLKLA